MDKVAIFIDGAYFSKILKESFVSAQVDFSKLSTYLANGLPILRTYYYNCMPYKSLNPTSGEINRYNNMQRFVQSLEGLDRYEVKLGKLEYRGRKTDGTPVFQQKRVDILLGCDLVLLSAKQRIEKAILITGDSDFIPAIQIAKNEGVEIELIYDTNHMPHRSLTQIADVRRALTQADIDMVKKQ